MNNEGLPPWPWRDGDVLGELIRSVRDARVGVYALIHTQRRVYRRDESGRAQGGPIPRYGWEPALIHGETKVSWLIGSERWPENATRYPKKPKDGDGKPRIYGMEEFDDLMWRSENAWRLGEHVRSIKDVALLQRIAQMTGFVAP